MSYVVSWKQSDGEPGWHPATDVQEATAFVEHLRNGSGVEAARIFRLDEVGFEFRPYFRVELAASTPPVMPAPAEPMADDPPAPVWGAATSVDVEVDEDAVANGAGVRRGLFGR